MSVLYRLALRALGMPGPVRARLGSLFEGERPGPDPGAGEEAPLAEPPVTRAGFDAAPPVAGPTVLHAIVPSPAPLAAPAPVAPPPAIAAFAPPIVTAAAATPMIQREAAASPAAGARAEIFATDPTVSRPAPRTTGAAVLAPAQPPPAAPSIRGSDSGVPSPAPAAFRPLLPEFVPPRAQSPPPTSRREAADRRQPDIQISIGRIEVRGEAERRRPAPAPRPAPATMSLEDYLAKGRRR
jgi:hypothetical protein